MATEDKTNDEGKKDAGFGFPFGGPQGMKEMMKKWCSSGTEFCNCCPIAKMTSDEESK